MPRKDILTLRLLLPVAAVFVSASCPSQLTIFLDRAGHVSITTMRLSLIMAYAELIYSFFSAYWIYAYFAGIVALIMVTFGPTVDQIATSTQSSWNWITRMAWEFAPTTQTSWGAIFVVSAFIFLGLGAVVSLRRPIAPDSVL